MGDTTKFVVDIDYRLTGIEKALAKTKDVGAATDKLARGLEWVKRAAIAAGGAFVFGKIGSALVGANRELESMQIGMATVLSMSLDKPFKDAEPMAARLVEHYRQIAKISPGTTNDFLEFHNLASGAVLGRGGSLGDLKKITEGGVIAGKAFGFRGDVAGRDVQQALTGNVSMQTPMIKMLLGSEKKIAEFNKMSGQQRVAALVQAFQSPALKDAAKKYGESFEGQLSTLKDNTDSLFRTIGKPLFVQLNKWMTQINAWADKNSAKITAWATSMGNSLATGARWIIKAVSFLVENKAVLVSMAGLVVGIRGLSNSPIGSFTSGLGLATAALSGFAVAAQSIVSGWDDLKGWLKGDKLDPSYRFTNKRERTADEIRLIGALNGMSDKDADSLALRGTMLPGGREMRQQMRVASGQQQWAQGLLWLQQQKKALDEENERKKAEKPPRQPVNVTIKRVEVVADDADRFIQDVISRVGQEITSPSQWRGMPLVGV